MRSANEIDFWRGFALVTIFINHVPGLYYERFTTRNVSLSDSAELFVFLAGWSMRYVVGSPAEGAKASLSELCFRLIGRAVTIYAAQILITMLALGLIAGASLQLDQPLLLEWHNAAAVFQDPIEAHVGLIFLTHQLGYFNILPLYIVLMSFAPLAAWLDRMSPWILLIVSCALWLTALISGANVPTWPVEGRWFFNPLAWQFIYMLGFVLARGEDGPGAFVRKHLDIFRMIAVPIVGVGIAAAWLVWSPDPRRLPEPRLLFMFDKTFLSPARLLQFLAVVAIVAGLYRLLPAALTPVKNYFAMLGRNSLNVFCVASILSLSAQIGRFAYGSSIGIDTIVLSFSLVCMGFSAWISEWRGRSRAA